MPLSPEAQAFLIENRIRNDKSFFDENRARYDALVVNPLAELVIALTPAMLEIDENLIVEPKIGRTISRVRRDTRFSKDKTLYRDNCWITFARDKKLYMGLPGFYFGLDPNGVNYGMGYYQASPQTMTALRELILGREPAFLAALEAFEGQNVFAMCGESYKKSRHPDEPENIRNWLDRKNIFFANSDLGADILFSDSLSQRLAEDFKLLRPMYDLFLAVEARKI